MKLLPLLRQGRVGSLIDAFNNMGRWTPAITAILLGLAVPGGAESGEAAARTFPVRGIILEIKADTAQVVIRHEAIAGYMEAMTMPFKAPKSGLPRNLQPGDQVSFEFTIGKSGAFELTWLAPEAQASARAAEGAVQKGEAQALRKQMDESAAKGNRPGAKMGEKP